ncbi:MAG: hypothetical protein JWL76_364 [Thermoleophilia bacterium]|nr:hypothetical protein [Thermoleophilia bacterium]
MNQTRLLLTALIAAASLGALLLLTAALALGASTDTGSTLGMLPGQVADIPPEMLTIYVRVGEQTGIDWAVLAAIGKVESDHARSTAAGVHSGVNFAGCCAGPMQISLAGGDQSTWGRYRADGNDDGRMSVYDPADAVLAAANYLKAAGAPGDYDRAIFAYNHAQWYVTKIQRIAEGYRQLISSPPIGATPWQVLASPRITLSPAQRSDVATGRVDARVLALLAWSAQRHTIYVSSLRSDHGTYTTSGNVSNHSLGRAVDIAMVDGAACQGNRDAPCGRLAVELARITGELHSTELIYCFDPDSESSDAWAAADHCDHVHAGFDQ